MAVRFHMTLDPVHPRVMHIPCQAEPSAPWARPLEWRKACRAAGARQQRFAAHVSLPSAGQPAHGWARAGGDRPSGAPALAEEGHTRGTGPVITDAWYWTSQH